VTPQDEFFGDIASKLPLNRINQIFTNGKFRTVCGTVLHDDFQVFSEVIGDIEFSFNNKVRLGIGNLKFFDNGIDGFVSAEWHNHLPNLGGVFY
jgi:hypothetical protein